MTIQEFSNEFDVLVGGPLFDEYEKSVFLTEAQNEYYKELYTGKRTLNGFEHSEEIRRYLANQVYQAELNPSVLEYPVLNGGTVFKLPDTPKVAFIVYESCTLKLDKECLPNKEIEVIPVKHDEYHKVKNNPFRGSSSTRVLRLDSYISEGDYVELHSKYPILNYKCRYLIRLNPIILVNLPLENSIDNETKAQTCTLHEETHRDILELAVAKALRTKVNNNSNQGY